MFLNLSGEMDDVFKPLYDGNSSGMAVHIYVLN